MGETVLSYSPASHHSWGVEPSMGDPFEEATVRVDQSGLRGAGQGLFVTRHIRLHRTGQLEVISSVDQEGLTAGEFLLRAGAGVRGGDQPPRHPPQAEPRDFVPCWARQE